MTRTILFALVAFSALALPSRAADKWPRCFSAAREGHCIAVQLNGQAPARLSGRTKKVLRTMDTRIFRGDEIRYELTTPLRGELSLEADWVPGAAALLGADPDVDAFVVPLEGQSLDTQTRLSTDRTVQVGGSAVVRQDEVLKENRLKPGKYLLAVRLSGTGNWDRQVVFFEVVE